MRYLASQLQDTLPYRLQNVESNDQIFIGNDDFRQEAEGLMDHCFEQIMEIIQKLDEVKEQYYPVLFEACLDSANILIGNCQISGKVNNYINKVTIQAAMESPELITRLGLIDNTVLDFHSGKLADYTKEADERSLEKLRAAREGLDNYGPEGLEGQELLSWKKKESSE